MPTIIQDPSAAAQPVETGVVEAMFGNSVLDADCRDTSLLRPQQNYGPPTWDGFAEGWLSVELGVQEYAYGDPFIDLNIWDQLQVDMSSGV